MPSDVKSKSTERLHARIAHSGLCSRRAAEKLIEEGRVAVNGEVVTLMGQQVGPDDEVTVDGRRISQARSITVLLNKPRGVLTTLSDPQKRPTVVKFIPDYGVQLKPVGRLDMETEGLLLVSNDGELANRLTHPRYGIEKEYRAVVRGIPSPTALSRLETGVFIEGRKTAPAQIKLLEASASKGSATVKVILHEGRKRQVRLMFEVIGHPVLELKRTRLGPLDLKGLRTGQCRLLGKQEVEALRRLVGLA